MSYIGSFKDKMAFDLGASSANGGSSNKKLNVAIAPPGIGAVSGLKELAFEIASQERKTFIDLNKTPDAFVYAEGSLGLLELSASTFSEVLLGNDFAVSPHFVGFGLLTEKMIDLSHASSGLLLLDMRENVSDETKTAIEDFCLTKSALQKDFSHVSIVLLAQNINDLPEKIQNLSGEDLYTFVCSQEKEDPFITSGHLSAYLKDKRAGSKGPLPTNLPAP